MAKAKRSPAFPPLLIASTEQSADMLYFGGVAVPDAFIAFGTGAGKAAVLSRLEIARVRREGDFDEVLSLEEWRDRVAGTTGGKGSMAEIVAALAKEYRVPGFRIPGDFPAGIAFALRDLGIELEIANGLLFPEREFKGDDQAAAIREGNAASSAGFKVVERVLRRAEIGRRNQLRFEGRPLTSERLRTLIEIACLERGATALNTIVAGGDQACDPHCRGSGVLRANELIIVDIFPRVARTGYHGDMTRTYLKGRASNAQRSLVAAVYSAHQESIAKHRAGRSAKKIYNEVQEAFAGQGYRTETIDGTPVGFFHGLGHGLGLEVHEPPRVSPAGGRLRKGQVVTVEPGLYYPGLGGCRIEDVLRVTAGEPEMLSKHPYRWEIR